MANSGSPSHGERIDELISRVILPCLSDAAQQLDNPSQPDAAHLSQWSRRVVLEGEIGNFAVVVAVQVEFGMGEASNYCTLAYSVHDFDGRGSTVNFLWRDLDDPKFDQQIRSVIEDCFDRAAQTAEKLAEGLGA